MTIFEKGTHVVPIDRVILMVGGAGRSWPIDRDFFQCFWNCTSSSREELPSRHQAENRENNELHAVRCPGCKDRGRHEGEQKLRVNQTAMH